MDELDLSAQLIPAFVSGGAFILIVAVGAVWMVGKQMAGWSRDEQVTAIRGLRSTGYIGFGLAVPLAIAAAMMSGRYGPSTYALPVSVVVSGVIFLRAGTKLKDVVKP